MPLSELPLPLNAMRVFEAAARLGGFAVAAATLGVTPSAVSHQVRDLELTVGVKLFVRRRDCLELTSDGRRLFERISPALATLLQARNAVRGDQQHVRVRASHSFALRWLIPRLAEFRRDSPGVEVTVETLQLPPALELGVDLAIFYARAGATIVGARHLMPEYVCPAASGQYELNGSGAKLQGMPLVSGTVDDWDWRDWAESEQLDPTELRIVARFDSDHAALIAAENGVGVCLVNEQMLEAEQSVLRPLPGFSRRHQGDYWLSCRNPLQKPAQRLVRWLQAQGRSRSGERR